MCLSATEWITNFWRFSPCLCDRSLFLLQTKGFKSLSNLFALTHLAPSQGSHLTHEFSLIQTEGIRGLYRGCALTVGRAAPSNAVLFCVYEMTTR